MGNTKSELEQNNPNVSFRLAGYKNEGRTTLWKALCHHLIKEDFSWRVAPGWAQQMGTCMHCKFGGASLSSSYLGPLWYLPETREQRFVFSHDSSQRTTELWRRMDLIITMPNSPFHSVVGQTTQDHTSSVHQQIPARMWNSHKRVIRLQNSNKGHSNPAALCQMQTFNQTKQGERSYFCVELVHFSSYCYIPTLNLEYC